MNTDSEEYDVVSDVLQKHHDVLWNMTKRNLESDYVGWNIMDDIREKQMNQIKEAIALWKNRHDR